MGEARLKFIAEVINPARMEAVKLFNEHIKSNKNEWLNEFISHFCRFCVQIADEQKRGAKGKIAHFTYSLLRTQLQQDQGLFLVEATDATWLLDRTPIKSIYEVNWVMKPLFWMEEIWAQRLKEQSHIYAGKVTPVDFEKFRLQEARIIHEVVSALIRAALPVAVETQEYAAVDKEDTFEIRVGGYMDWSEKVFESRTEPEGNN
ncbi:hypothetical protein LBW89_18420 [Paenibacillus sp. alder61]|uniref:Uncharacterized protein n=1 Tax=Paenibacillus faecis TaxID=862114 RepID=A0A5D0CNC2_9BACL|nr:MULTISPECIES: hypothetical protein [Paenibacillus]MCA1294990.1 hypothetical protein [Paenibacillus sp. alder61]TYA10745.1 hypothetical protein FRY98_23465 [Paenibacillus faecis]